MTDPAAGPTPASFTPRGVFLGALAGIGGHAIVFAAAFIAGRVVEPSSGGGFEDIAAVVGVFFLGEAILTLACVIAGIVLVRKDKRDLGVGVALGWAVGILVYVILVMASSSAASG